MRLRLLTSVTALVVALALAGCGKAEVTRFGETEAAYLDLGDMKYQVRISREMTPAAREDPGFLMGADEKPVRRTRRGSACGCACRTRRAARTPRRASSSSPTRRATPGGPS